MTRASELELSEKMHRTYVAVDRVVASALWLGATALVLVDVLTPINTGDIGLLAGMGASVVCVRGYVLRVESELRNAFELGRDYEIQSVRKMRRPSE